MDDKSDAYWDGYINAMMEGVEEGKAQGETLNRSPLHRLYGLQRVVGSNCARSMARAA